MKNSQYFFLFSLGDHHRRLDAAAALLRVDEIVLPRLLCLPRHLPRRLVVVELLDDEALGVLELLLGIEADRCFFKFCSLKVF